MFSQCLQLIPLLLLVGFPWISSHCFGQLTMWTNMLFSSSLYSGNGQWSYYRLYSGTEICTVCQGLKSLVTKKHSLWKNQSKFAVMCVILPLSVFHNSSSYQLMLCFSILVNTFEFPRDFHSVSETPNVHFFLYLLEVTCCHFRSSQRLFFLNDYSNPTPVPLLPPIPTHSCFQNNHFKKQIGLCGICVQMAF